MSHLPGFTTCHDAVYVKRSDEQRAYDFIKEYFRSKGIMAEFGVNREGHKKVKHERKRVVSRKVQGGAASGYTTLITKATDKYSEEFIQKASQIRVTLSLPDFLETFFHVWEDDAEIIAAMFGYQDIEDDENEYDKESFW